MLSHHEVPSFDSHPKDGISSVSAFHSSIVAQPSSVSQLDSIEKALAISFEPTPFRHGAQLQPLPDVPNVFVLTDGNRKTHLLTVQPQDRHGQQCLGNAAMISHDYTEIFHSMQGDQQMSLLLPAPILAQGSQGPNEPQVPQEDRWDKLYQKLLRYKDEHGHCVIPQNYAEDLVLARWIRRQRYQYKRKVHNKTSSMSDRRWRLLEQIGFAWDPQTDVWEIRLEELEEYKRTHGDCNVPSRYPHNPQLASWVKRQRRQYQEMLIGRSTGLPSDRVARLNNMGFVWSVRGNNNSSDA